MKNIFIGLLLIFLDFNLTLGSSKIELLPDFVGYIVMIKGLVEMEGESALFSKIKPYVTGMAVYSAFLFLMDLIGASVSFGAFTYILAIASTIVSLYISYNIVMGVIDMEGKYNRLLNGNSLKSAWTFLAVFSVLTFVSLLIPLIALICIFVSVMAAIYFLVAFNTSKNLYYGTIG